MPISSDSNQHRQHSADFLLIFASNLLYLPC